MNFAWRALLAARSPAGPRGRLTVLIFHRVLPAPDPLFPGEADAARFDAVCGWLAQWFAVLPLGEAVQRLQRGALPARAAAITFDDGYADNHDVALPILQRHGLHATFFVATGFLDGGCMFNDRVIEAVRRSSVPALDLHDLRIGIDAPLPLAVDGASRRAAIERVLGAVKYLPPPERDAAVSEVVRRCASEPPDALMMRSAQVRALHAAGMAIGAHTHNHPILARLSAAQARAEIAQSREHLQGLIGAPVPLFAYPNGKPAEDYHAGTVEIVRGLGFEAAVTTAWGAASAQTDPFQLPRFTPWDRQSARFGWRLLANLGRPSVIRAPDPEGGGPLQAVT